MSFGPLTLTWDGDKYVLAQPLVYKHSSGTITVPAGFQTDLDSVPRLPVAYWLLKGRSRRPAVIHDYLYATQAGRSYADRVFLDAMAEVGVPRWQRYPIYWGVRAGGMFAYRAHGSRA